MRRREVITNLARSLRGEAVYGMHSVEAALRWRSREPHRLLLVDKYKTQPRLKEIVALAEAQDLPVEVHNKGSLNTLLPHDQGRHQGVVLDADPLDIPLVDHRVADELLGLQHENAVVLALDELTDPQNVGALLRTALFLGCDGVLLSKKNTAPASPAVSRASAGALEELAALGRMFSTAQMPKLLETCRSDGWRVLGTGLSSDAVPAHDVRSEGVPTILVMGNEGDGLRTNVMRACDRLVLIPPRSDPRSGVDSLNVSACGAILLHQLTSPQQ